MLSKARLKKILDLAIPCTIALASNLVMVLIDLAMVGSLGNNALAAVGIAGFSTTLVLALVTGIAPAVQSVVARREGEKSTEPKCLPINGGLLLVLLIGLPLTMFCYFLTPYYFPLVSSDPGVTKEGVPYLQAMYLAIMAVGMNNAFRGHWTGVSKAKVYMFINLFINLLNIFLNYVFIYGNLGAPELGTQGAGIASCTSLYVGTFIFFIYTSMKYRNEGFLKIAPQKFEMANLFKIGMPATMQEFFYALGYLVFFWMVGMVGTSELAAANVLTRITLLLLLFSNALAMTSATLVSRAVGEEDLDGAARWGWDIGKLGVVFVTTISLPLLIFPQWFLGVFLHDPATVEMAVIPLQMVAATTGIGGLIYIFSFSLFTVGDGNRVLAVSFTTQWFIFIPAVWIVGPYLQYGLFEIWLVQMVYGVSATALITSLWAGGKWKEIAIKSKQ